MVDVLKTDICIIGAGSGGLSVGAAAAALKTPVVLIEKGEPGGDCLNTGCVPSKAMVAAGKAAAQMRGAARFGIATQEPDIDFEKVMAGVKASIAAIGASDSQARYEAMGVRVIRAAARFVAKDRVEAGGVTIKARRFVIATGSSPTQPPISGLASAAALTTDTIFDLKTLPRRLLVIGAGAVGLELAQAFRRLGSGVEVLDNREPLAGMDRELAGVALRALAQEGVVIRAKVDIKSVEPHGEGVRATYMTNGWQDHAEATHLLIATGRKANVENLGLEAAGVAFTPDGVTVNSALQSATNPKVYAVGDVAGAGQYTHLASYQAGLVIRQALFRLKVSANMTLVPHALLTDPEVASVGLSEAEARKTHAALNILRFPFSENDRAQTDGHTSGLIKIVATPAGQILGCGIAGPQAGELITPWTMALAQGLSVKQMADIVIPYPTLSEVSRRAAMSWYAPQLARPGLARLLRFMRFWG